jgi:hypothetical protein
MIEQGLTRCKPHRSLPAGEVKILSNHALLASEHPVSFTRQAFEQPPTDYSLARVIRDKGAGAVYYCMREALT